MNTPNQSSPEHIPPPVAGITPHYESRLPLIYEVVKFEHWTNVTFLLLFLSATFMGTILNYSTFLCTSINSALTTTVVGCLKNVLTTYIGMVFMAGYEFTWLNFFGLTLSVFGSLYYTYISIYLTATMPNVNVNVNVNLEDHKLHSNGNNKSNHDLTQLKSIGFDSSSSSSSSDKHVLDKEIEEG
jgi:hypothetical protein